MIVQKKLSIFGEQKKLRKNEYNIDIIYCIMTENISMTRIADLPDSTSISNNEKLDLGQNMYVPINEHPNPYGIPPPNIGSIGLPQDTQINSNMKNTIHQMPPQYSPDQIFDEHQRLPQRDIPMNVSQHVQDEEIQPNYIPKPKLSNDYIREHEIETREQMQTFEKTKQRESNLDLFLDEIQTPLLVGLLYLIFQLPIVNTTIFKQFSFLQIYKEDGNFNFLGLILKSSLFAFIFMSHQKLIAIVTNWVA